MSLPRFRPQYLLVLALLQGCPEGGGTNTPLTCEQAPTQPFCTDTGTDNGGGADGVADGLVDIADTADGLGETDATGPDAVEQETVAETMVETVGDTPDGGGTDADGGSSEVSMPDGAGDVPGDLPVDADVAAEVSPDGGCVPQCAGKQCGVDGCGGVCGTCSGNDTCDAAGQCGCQPDCSGKQCGTDGCGGSCGSCGASAACNGAGQCIVADGALGSFCGPTAACPQLITDVSGQQVLNPDFAVCVAQQCQSGFCIHGQGLTYSAAPVCSKSCTITQDAVNNATGASGSDGVEDPSGSNTECSGFVDGPNGDAYRCVNYAPAGQAPVSFCTPGQDFAQCNSSDDCPADEMCAMVRIQGVFAERCIGAFQEGSWADAADGGEACNEADPFEDGGLKFCGQGGLCFGFGCAPYCSPGATTSPSDDVGCDTTKWEPGTGCNTSTGTCMTAPSVACTQDIDCSWLECGLLDQTIFSNDPYAGDFCYPKSCNDNSDCPDSKYCRFSFGGEVDSNGLPVWEHLCLPETEGGVGLGEACDANPSDGIPGATCASTDMCFGGFCSQICDVDGDCAANQLCHVIEFQIDDPSVPAGEQSLPLATCLAYEGSMSPCLAQTECPSGERCELYTYFNKDVGTQTTAPIFEDGICVTSTGAGETGANCTGPEDCAGGWCLGADAANGTPGFCSQLCATASDCPSIDDGSGGTLNGVCTNLWTGYGGDSRRVDTRIYAGVCRFTEASATACGPGVGSCPSGEFCGAIVVGSGPNNPASTDYLCLANENPVGSPAPSVPLGGTCDPLLTDGAGEPVEQCLSGICFEGAQVGVGFCSQVCDPSNDTCATDLNDAAAFCDSVVTQPRPPGFEANEGKWSACRKDTNCSPCSFSEGCPGDRVCVNLGPNDDAQADYRCVPSCSTSADCSGSGGGDQCNPGTDVFGTENFGCFDVVFDPINFCD